MHWPYDVEIYRSSCTDSKCRGLRKHPPRQRCLSETQQNLLLLNPQWHLYPEWSRKTDVFESAVDAFWLEVLDDALNKLPPSRKKRKEMTESELNSFISNADWNTQARYKIKVLQDTTLVTNRSPLTKSNVHVLPLSLDDNNTIVGTMSTLD